ncbi:MAG: M14 family zinc carboxypeptidase [Bacteroidia bacterium]|nr:M14 family zinc carboxypeptidase [Bacteroidia bacterium]
MKKRLLILSIGIFCCFSLSAQDSIDSFRKLFQGKQELYVRFPESKLASLARISDEISLDHNPRRDGFIYAYIYPRNIEVLLKESLQLEVLPAPSSLEAPIMRNWKELTSRLKTNSTVCSMNWNFFPTYQAYENLMLQFQTDYPAICKIDTIAQLNSGRRLLVAHIGDNLDVDEDEPEFLYTSSMHGDETTGYNLSLHLIAYLLCNYGADPEITNLLNEVDIWINPLANPNGAYAGGNNSVAGATRANANGFDLNRNFPDPDPNDGPRPGGTQQEETTAFINFAAERDFTISANLHGGVEVANYPWDTYGRRHPDDNWWIHVCRDYADTTQANSPVGFFNDFNNGITNGSDWFFVSGGRQDYMNSFEYCREFTLELSNSKNPPSISLEAFWDYHQAALVNYMEEALFGLRGIVTDSISEEALLARVFIDGHDQDSSHVYSSMPIGNYHRYLFAGSYDVSFTAEGYLPKTLTVAIQNGQSTRLDVQLVPDVAAGIADRNKIPFSLFPNPASDKLEIELKESFGEMEVQLIDLSGKILQVHQFEFQTDAELEVKELAAGMYFVRIKTERGFGIEKFLKK